MESRSLTIRRLERGDNRRNFSSGEPLLDDFLLRFAGQNQFRHHIAVTYVAVDEPTREVLGYVTVQGGSMSEGDATNVGVSKVPYGHVPILRIARLAVDSRMRGAGLGTDLLRYVLLLALRQSQMIGCAGIVVDAKPEACGFYQRFGFRVGGVEKGASPVRPRRTPMFLSRARVQSAVAQPVD